MEVLIEKIIIYGSVTLLCLIVLIIYWRKQKKVSQITGQKIEKAKKELVNLREQRKAEIGQIAYTCGIAELSNDALKTAFMALAQQHAATSDA